MNPFGIAFVILCVHLGGMAASMIPHGGNPGNSIGVASLWELHSFAKALVWLGKQAAPIDPQIQQTLNDLSGKLDGIQSADAAKIDGLTQKAAAQNTYIQTLLAAMKTANISVPPAPTGAA